MMNLPKPRQWATAYATKDFISVNTCSGMRRYVRDPSGREEFFLLDDSDIQIGAGILGALSVSKFLSSDEIGDFFDIATVEKNYEEWVELLTEKYGYKSRRALFKDMKHCMIDRVDDVITIKPTNHEKLEAWSGKGIDSNDYEVVSSSASEVELGLALRRCFERCL